ncbi:hypothetical protein EVAR_14554_1 [Eumeta japonica]|uniref:Acyltransferase 3 domain-containing protein n=1 Tax=Eumeta variegata TaxID=151549 RepID=A0A4C1U3J0_EUMVA|nr:hypothetical protein EVAR_14554_1 [Eumeta japonica]
MPQLFRLDDYDACLSRPTGAYCVGSFELTDDGRSPLMRLMKRYSANWVDRFNHTRLHRGVCVTASCAPALATDGYQDLPKRFARCINASVWATHRLHARLQHLAYCRTGAERTARLAAPLTPGQLAFSALAAALLALSVLSTACDLLLPADHPHRKHGTWMLAWSVPRAWRALAARPARAALDLSACDGLRVVCMLCVIVEHVCWLAVTAYVATPRFSETTRRAGDAIMMVNSSLVVQVFFVLSSFFLALKLLQQARAGPMPITVLVSTLVNRLIRISPAYWLIVGYAGTWWVRAGDGPLWTPLVEREADACTHKWWAQLLYLEQCCADGRALPHSDVVPGRHAAVRVGCCSDDCAGTLGPWTRARGVGGAVGGGSSGAAGGGVCVAATTQSGSPPTGGSACTVCRRPDVRTTLSISARQCTERASWLTGGARALPHHRCRCTFP